MSPESLIRYKQMVAEKIRYSEEMLASLEEARNTADSRKTSRYDTQREIFAGDANVQRVFLHRLREFDIMLGRAGPKTRIEFGAEFTMELWDQGEEVKDAIYAPVSIDLPDTTIITPSSPVGTAIEGMVAGNTFVYKIKDQLMAGVIKEIK